MSGHSTVSYTHLDVYKRQAQVSDPFEYIISGELKRCKCVADRCIVQSRVVVGNLIENTFRIMQYMVFLIVISDLNFCSEFKRAVLRVSHLV